MRNLFLAAPFAVAAGVFGAWAVHAMGGSPTEANAFGLGAIAAVLTLTFRGVRL